MLLIIIHSISDGSLIVFGAAFMISGGLDMFRQSLLKLGFGRSGALEPARLLKLFNRRADVSIRVHHLFEHALELLTIEARLMVLLMVAPEGVEVLLALVCLERGAPNELVP